MEILYTFAFQNIGMGRLELVMESEFLSVYSPKFVYIRTAEQGCRYAAPLLLRISERILIIGGGGVKKVQRFEDDAVLNGIVIGLRTVERKIKAAVRKSGIDMEDFEGMKDIVDDIEI